MTSSRAEISAAPDSVFRVGLTGGIGSGKSTVAEIWRAQGIDVIDLDDLARAVLDEPGDGVEEAVAFFGESVRNSQGTIDRAKVATRVFSNSEDRKVLEKIVHGRVWAAVTELEARVAADAESPAAGLDGSRTLVVHDSPLLFEQNSDAHYRVIVAVCAPRESRIRRVIETRRKTRAYVESIMANQVGEAERVERADLLVNNGGSRAELQEEALRALEQVRMANIRGL